MQLLRFFRALFVLSLVMPSLVLASSKVPMSADLKMVGDSAQETKRPVLVVFAAEHCGFCDRLEADHLGPMARSQDYDGRVIIRKVMIDSYADIKDFEGNAVSTEDFADRYGVSVTPTVMIFDDKGKRLSKKLIGYNGNAYYGWDLDKLISSAQVAMRKPL